MSVYQSEYVDIYHLVHLVSFLVDNVIILPIWSWVSDVELHQNVSNSILIFCYKLDNSRLW